MSPFESETRQDAAIIRCKGDIGTYDMMKIRGEMERLIEGGSRAIIVDFSGARDISSTATGLLVTMLPRVRTAGGDILISGVAGKVGEVFEVIRVPDAIRTFGTLDEALAAAADD